MKFEIRHSIFDIYKLPSSRGLGLRLFTPATGVRNPLGALRRSVLNADFFCFGTNFANQIFMYYVYLIYSEKYDSYYIGQTNNLEDRLNRHNQNRCKFTKNKGPWILIGYKICKSRSEAVLLENRFKRLKNSNILLTYFNK